MCVKFLVLLLLSVIVIIGLWVWMGVVVGVFFDVRLYFVIVSVSVLIRDKWVKFMVKSIKM